MVFRAIGQVFKSTRPLGFRSLAWLEDGKIGGGQQTLFAMKAMLKEVECIDA